MTRKALFEAIGANSLKTVEKLLKSGTDVNGSDWSDKTPLLLAIEGQQTDIVTCLLEHGAKPDLADKDGRSAFHHAMMSGVRGILQILLTRTVNINLEDKNGQTPLHYAVERKWTQIVEWLVFLGADVNKEDRMGNSAKSLVGDEKLLRGAIEQPVDLERHTERILADHCEEKCIRNMTIKFGSETDFGSSKTFMLLKRYEPTTHPKCPAKKKDESFWGELVECRISQPNILLTITFPLQDKPSSYSEVFVKYATMDKEEKESVAQTVFMTVEQRWIAEAKINIGACGWFVICHRPGEELLEVPANGGKITSTLDTDVEMDIPKNTFERPGSISFKVEECLPVTKDLDAILSFSKFYDIEHTSGTQPKQGILLTLPLPDKYTGKGELVVLSRAGPENVSSVEEDTEYWTFLDTDIEIKGNVASFTIKHFSTKAMMESPRNTPRRTQRRQISKCHRRRKIHIVTFLAYAKQLSPKLHDVIVECCKAENLKRRTSAWEKANYSCLRVSGMFQARPEHEYGMAVAGNAKSLSNISRLKITYFPGMNCYQPLELEVIDLKDISRATIAINNLQTADHDVLTFLPFILDINAYSSQSTSVSKSAVDEVDRGLDEAYDPELYESKGKFIVADLTASLSVQVFCSWWKIWLYLGHPLPMLMDLLHKDLYDSLEGSKQVLRKWFSASAKAADFGITKLTQALVRVDNLSAAQSVIDYLEMCWKSSDCKHEWQNKPFWNWLKNQTFSLDSFIGNTSAPEPMSNMFLLDILKYIEVEPENLGTFLGLTKQEIDTTTCNIHKVGRECRVFVVLLRAREKHQHGSGSLYALLEGLEQLDQNDAKESIMQDTETWLQSDGQSNGKIAEQIRMVIDQFT
ncbi:uncharacterized protein [Haliotis cracherodii]|uniref:uncharacterized protein n=1 Tax=Haliotis cracherodii TaxID=6455 RepID=UPI0039EC2BF4